MAFSPQSFSIRAVLTLGLEALPWIGLAASVSFVPLPSGLRIPPTLASLGILLLAGIVLAIRHSGAAPFSNPPSRPEGPTDSDTPPSPATSFQSGPHTSYPEPQKDSLTGLADRTRLLSKLSESLEEASSSAGAHGPLPALFTIRIHEYNDVTDSFGHQAGQDLVTAAASRISEVPPPTATTARIAEDTFAVLLPETDDDEAWEVGEALEDHLEAPFEISSHEIPLTASIGLALRPSSDALFESAEEMLQASYSALHQGQRGDVLTEYENGNGDSSQRLQRRERLREAIQDDELTLHYQPIVHLVSGTPVGAEALVRWDHPDRGLLSPVEFIPLAEETGLVGELDRWVFDQALRDADRWIGDPESPLDWISVNISPQSVEGDLQTWCRHQLDAINLPEGALHLEITERWALRDERSLQPLRDEGVRLSIDDFGTGYSSLRYLRSLNADVLKIDSEFIQDLGQDEKTTAIVQFLMNLSLRLDVEVIAEGVETAQQEQTLRELGCAMAQGYHFGRPVPAEELFGSSGSSLSSSPVGNVELLSPSL